MLAGLGRSLIAGARRFSGRELLLPACIPLLVIPLGVLFSRCLPSVTKKRCFSSQSQSVNKKKKDAPIFEIIRSDCEADVLQEYINENPSCLQIYDHRGRLPLHVYCQQSEMSINKIRVLTLSCPQSVMSRDKFFGALPLHMAVHRDSQNIEALELLIQEFPDALMTVDGGGFLPIHRAVHRSKPNISIINLLLKHSPESASIKTTNGNLALHWACIQDSPCLSTLRLLKGSYPEGVFVFNEKGETPLDILLQCKASKGDAIACLRPVF